MDTFVQLADTLTGDYEIGDFLQLLVDRCAGVLDVAAAGVMLETPDGQLRLAAGTSAEMEQLEQAEMEFMEGPCLDAYRGAQQVLAHDLREADDRWPNTASRAVSIGLLGAYAFPLQLREQCIGALNLYRDEPGQFDEGDVQLAQAYADIATIGILQERRAAEGGRLSEQLQLALDSRVLVEQAKAVIHERHDVDLVEALNLLRREAEKSDRQFRDVCRDVLIGASLSEPS